MRVGLCHGVFDILHFGHVRHFQAAREKCDRLIVSVTSDEFVNKGENRPVFSLEQRMAVISAIRFVDEVIASRSSNGINSLRQVSPAFYFKDIEYKDSAHPGFLAEKSFCEVNNIELILTEELRSSSSEALQRLRRASGG